MVVLLAAAAYGLIRAPSVGMGQLAKRFVTPLRAIPAVTTTRLTLQPQVASVVEGEPLRITVSAERLGDDVPTLYHGPIGSTAFTPLAMSPSGNGTFRAVITPVTQDLRYFARGGDGRTVIGAARVLRKPTLAEVRVRYTYPPYADRPPLVVSNTDGLIEAPAGSEAAITFVASEPIGSAVMNVGDRRLQTTAGDSPRERRASITVAKDQAYTLDLVSADHVPGSGKGGMMIRAILDRPPLVQVLQPPGELRLSPRDILSLPFQALDDYGIASLTTNVQITASGVNASGEPINLARGKPATQPSTWGGAGAERAVDGKTDGAFMNGSVTHTENTGNPWWQVDLGNVSPVAVVEIWNRTDAVPQRLSDFNVFVSDAPFLSDDPTAIKAQAGVSTYQVAGQCGTPTRIEVFRTARFVRVQLGKPEYLSLAEVRVLQAKPIAAGELASRSFDSNLPISGDPRQQSGEATLDLAKIKVRVGDVITVSVNATDTGKQPGVGGPIRVVVSPRSVDQRTYDRINELKRAVILSATLQSQLEAAARSFEPAAARGVGQVDAYIAALAGATRELSNVSETTNVLQSSLLRCIIRSDGPQLSVALASMVDQLQVLTASASALGATFAFDSAPSPADRATLTADVAAAKRIATHVTAILRGEQAGAILADLDNLRASEQGTPTAKEAADRARERARRVREDIALATKELGLLSDGPELQSTLNAMVAARVEAMRSYGLPDYVTAAQAFADAMARGQALPALVPRLSAAAQAEAIRGDGNLVRARDLQLAASAALRVRDAAAATREEFIASFAQAVAVLQEEHSTASVPLPPPTSKPATAPAATTTASPATTQAQDAVHVAAADARRKLALWARGESVQSANEAEALARAQELAMQANADLAQRAYESAEQADERIARELRVAERTFPSAVERFEQARQQVRRSTEKAKQIDRLSAAQEALTSRTTTPDRAALQEAQQKLAAEVEKAAEDEGDGRAPPGAAATDTRLAAASAIRAAQERLTAMPQQLRDVESALSERANVAARLQQLRVQAMPADEQNAAARAIRGAEEQLREVDARLAERLTPLAEATAVELARSLSPYAPETTDAVRGVVDRLAPAMSRLQRAAAAGADDAASAVAELRGAIDGLQTQLTDAQGVLLERDPLTAARAYAHAASSALTSDVAGAAARQRDASAALSRAWDAAIHDAAAARLAGLPTMRPLFAPAPAGSAPPQTPAAAAASKFPMFFDWGRLPWRQFQDAGGSPRASDPSGYEDALQAYFEALGVTQPPATTQQVKQ
jgi:hypothetical protein